MGQRLNIEIAANDKTLASCMYQYGATTDQSIYLTEQILTTYERWFGNADADIYVVLRILEHTGAGVNGAERQRIRRNENHELACVEFMPARGLSYGMIFLTKEGIREARRWEDARITIDLENQTICFGVFYYTLAEEYFADEDWFREIEELPQMDADGDIFNKIHFDHFAGMRTIVEACPNGVRMRNGDLIEWIE